MKNTLAFVLASLAAFALGAPSQTDARSILRRAIGDTCRAPEGSGTCETTSQCRGISYPTGLCPNDPADVQCCVEITCGENGRSGFCRSVANNGCSGGEFSSGLCPGPNDIKCCIKTPRLSPPAADAADPSTSWPGCRERLRCTFAQLELTSLQERLDYVRYMQAQHFGPLNSDDQFRAIEGVIRFFIVKGLGGPGTWVSYVDAGIVEGIQNGGAIALGKSSATGGNPGSEKWAGFMRAMRDGSFADRNAHDKAWSESEQSATEYGVSRGNAVAGMATGQIRRWYQFTQLFRAIMRNREKFRFIPFSGSVLDWLTDVTNDEPSYCGGLAAWDLSGFDDIPITITDWTSVPFFLGKVFGKLLICIRNE